MCSLQGQRGSARTACQGMHNKRTWPGLSLTSCSLHAGGGAAAYSPCTSPYTLPGDIQVRA